MLIILLLLAQLFSANFDQFNANMSSNDLNNQSSDLSSSLPVAPTATSSSPTTTVDVDPFQTVDPFASQSDIGSTTSNTDWFQPSNNQTTSTTVDPFLPKTEPTESLPLVASPRMKKAAPKANRDLKGLIIFQSLLTNIFLFYRYIKITTSS
jgi:hypothetical protein